MAQIFKSPLCFYNGPGRIIFLETSATAMHTFFIQASANVLGLLDYNLHLL